MTTTTTVKLTGQDLLAKIEELGWSTTAPVSTGEVARTCGFVNEKGSADYTGFYYAVLEARGVVNNCDKEAAEDNELKDKLSEQYGEGAVDAFLEYWEVDDLKHFEDAYIGCYRSGAEFAEEHVCYGETDQLPFYVVIDWEKTWDNLEGDYVVEGDYYFYRNW
jgi:hypothetical protein